MDKVNIGESTLKDFGNVINEAADILNKGKVAFDNSIPDKTLQVLPYTGQAGAIIPSQIGDLDNLTTTAKDNLVNAINEVNNNLSSNTNVVTLDTDQTITGVKTFEDYVVTNREINLGDRGALKGDSTGIVLSSKRILDSSNNISIDSNSGLHLTARDGSFNLSSHSSLGIITSVYGGSIQMNTYTNGDISMKAYGEGAISLNNSGSKDIDISTSGSGGISLWTKNQSTPGSIRIDSNSNITLRSYKNLSVEIGNTGTLHMDPHAKSEFQRVLEIPSTTGLLDQSTNQSINSTKTFTVLPVSTGVPSNAHHMTNKAYVDSVGNAKVALSGNQTIAGNKTFSGATTTAAFTANGNTALNGNTTFKLIPNCAVKPTGNNHLANKLYVDNLGGVVSSGAAIDFRKGNHFMVNLSANAQISVANWGGVAGKSGTITILNANRITGFRAPFNFRVAQSGFTGTEVFSYYCYSSGLIRIVRS